MSVNFAELRKNQSSLFKELNKQIESENQSYSSDDENYWKLTIDPKTKNGFAVIRFLPPPPNENAPYIRYFDHGFQGPGGWYIERSLTTFRDTPDPVSEYNSEKWQTGIEANKDIARKQKRRVHYVANVLVVNDPAKPENNGKVFKYRFGKSIFNLIESAIRPSDEEMAVDPDIKPINIFHPDEGANFKLKSYDKAGWVNYEKSEFTNPGPIADDDEEMERIWLSTHSLQEELDQSKYKSYDELKARFERVIGISASVASDNTVIRDDEVADQDSAMDEIMSQADKSDDDMGIFERLAHE